MTTKKGEDISHLDKEVQELIHKLDLEPHPEAGGTGFFRETFRGAGASSNERATSTAIYFLLAKGGRSHWHAVDADEIWLWHAGSPLELSVAASSGKEKAQPTIRLGPDVLNGEMPQYVVKNGEWQAADAKEGWTLVSCIVAPGFEFEGFKMAEQGWEPGQ